MVRVILLFFARVEFDSPNSILDLHFQVRRARLVSAEAKLEGMLQMLKPEAIRTSPIAAIQKGTIGDGLGHEAFPGRRNRE